MLLHSGTTSPSHILFPFLLSLLGPRTNSGHQTSAIHHSDSEHQQLHLGGLRHREQQLPPCGGGESAADAGAWAPSTGWVAAQSTFSRILTDLAVFKAFTSHQDTSQHCVVKTLWGCVTGQAGCSCSCGQQGEPCSFCSPPPSPESAGIHIHSSHLNCVTIGDNNYMHVEQTLAEPAEAQSEAWASES